VYALLPTEENGVEEVELGLFDGQHRVRALEMLLHEKNNNSDENYDFQLVVEVWPVLSHRQVALLYRDVNKAEPVQDIDLHLASLLGGEDVDVRQHNNRSKEIIAESVRSLFDM
jgi:hypothetical protein